MSTCNRDQILKDHRLKLFWLIYLLRAEFVSYVLNGEKSGAAGLSITGAVWHDIICGMKPLVSFFIIICSLAQHHHIPQDYPCHRVSQGGSGRGAGTPAARACSCRTQSHFHLAAIIYYHFILLKRFNLWTEIIQQFLLWLI